MTIKSLSVTFYITFTALDLLNCLQYQFISLLFLEMTWAFDLIGNITVLIALFIIYWFL